MKKVKKLDNNLNQNSKIDDAEYNMEALRIKITKNN